LLCKDSKLKKFRNLEGWNAAWISRTLDGDNLSKYIERGDKRDIEIMKIGDNLLSIDIENPTKGKMEIGQRCKS
jgi:hypothetical protein